MIPLESLTPAGQVWRLGADEATIITTDKSLMIGSAMLQPGSYSLYAAPNPGKWKRIINKKTGQWGIPYQKELELGRTPMMLGTTKAAVENVTISIDDTSAGASLRVEWGHTSVTAPFTIG